ncbi:MAG: TatD family hydrolase [Ignavibacteriae bacterium]|nr:TatD family hydrolase [Ignavibacteriota bacterium]
MYIDSHAHLFYEDFRNDLPDVIRRAQDAGVETIVVPGTTRETSRDAVELSEKYPFIYACVGFHPHDASKADAEGLKEIEELSRHPKVVAIGEIGLDFHYDFSPRNKQESVFQAQIEIAVRRNLPIVVHTRESMSQAIETVQSAARKYPDWKMNDNAGRGVFHCFTGNTDEARELFQIGFYVSYPGIVTFKNSPVVDTLKAIGLKNVLLETDSPYLAPVPLRGKRNEPGNVSHIANKVAEICSLQPSEVGKITSENTRRLFGIDRN